MLALDEAASSLLLLKRLMKPRSYDTSPLILKQLLKQLGLHAIDREYAHLRVQYPGEALPFLMCRMFEEVCERHAILVSEWLRVGYCQGNMNSDNRYTAVLSRLAAIRQLVLLYNSLPPSATNTRNDLRIHFSPFALTLVLGLHLLTF